MPGNSVNTNLLTESSKVVSAIILAGGYSSRMKAFKPLLPLGDSTVIENTINVFQNSGVHDIAVVTGHGADDLKVVLDSIGVKWIYNKNYHQGMYSSVTVGVSSLPRNSSAFFLLPADMPLIKTETIKELIRVYNRKEYDIIYPTYKGHRGHPPLISSRLFPKIKNWHGEGGLRALLSQYQQGTTQVDVADEGILTDMDNPEDYIRIHNKFPKIIVK